MSTLLETERLIITKMTMDMAMDVHKNSLDDDTRRFVPDEVFETVDVASGRVLEKCGFQTFFTGEGAYHDGVYEISKSIWKA